MTVVEIKNVKKWNQTWNSQEAQEATGRHLSIVDT
jgi:hypothetical protein